MIPAGFSKWAKHQIEASIRAHDMRLNCTNQRTYRLGIDAKLRAGQRPNFLSIHVLRCIYFRHTNSIQKRLRGKGYSWMLETNVVWDGMLLHLRVVHLHCLPACPHSLWTDLEIAGTWHRWGFASRC